MKSLTRKNAELDAVGKSFTGRYVATDAEGHLFTDEKGIEHYVPKTVHTDLGVSQITAGEVVFIQKTKNGHDVSLLEPEEVLAWEKIDTKTE